MLPIALRPWETPDAAALAALLGNPHVHRFLSPALPRPYGLQEAAAFIHHCQQHSEPERAILLGETLVGGIGARVNGGMADLGYWLGEPYWRQGIMRQAIRLFLELLPTWAPPVHTITARAYDFNTASRALLLSCGFQQTGAPHPERGCDGLEHPTFTYTLGLADKNG